MAKLSQEDVLEIINSGEDCAYGILYDADPKLAARFKRVDKSMSKLLEDVKEHFPDAVYYTASGGFNLMLGASHDDNNAPQQSLVACSGNTNISDGDF